MKLATIRMNLTVIFREYRIPTENCKWSATCPEFEHMKGRGNTKEEAYKELLSMVQDRLGEIERCCLPGMEVSFAKPKKDPLLDAMARMAVDAYQSR